MAEYIELIDKYRIEQGEGDYNPPSYRWVDNTGEIVRCGECKYWDKQDDSPYGYCRACKHGHYSEHWEIGIYRRYKADWFCADGEREVQE